MPTALVKRTLPPYFKPADERRPQANNAKLIAQARLLRAFQRFGIPELLVADNGRELFFREVGRVMRSAVKDLNTRQDRPSRDAGDDSPGTNTP